MTLASNPVFIPRNHLVEDAIDAAVREQDFSAFHALVEVLADPYTFRAELERFALPPGPERPACVTYCGT